MDLLARLFDGSMHAQTPGPLDDFWYQSVGTLTQSGLRIDSEGAKKISAWFRGRNILATSLAMLPLSMWRKLPNDDGRERAGSHPLDDVIHRKPNPWQDSFQWRRQQMFHIIDHGNGYNRIVEGRRGFADQLQPIHPTLVKPELQTSGRILYRVRNPKTSEASTYTQDEIFHLRGACDHGVEGKGILEYARDSIGLGVALESYASRLFSQGVLHGGVLEVPGELGEEASQRMARSFVTSQRNWHMPKVLEQGAKFVASGLDPEKAQFILSRKFTINDIARWLGLPPHMLADLERSTNNNIEHQGQEFVTYSLGEWLSLWEFSINDQLVLVPQTYYAEFTRDALVRGDIATRWAAHVSSVNAGIVAPDEVRSKENLRKMGGKASELREPQNITGAQSFPNQERRPSAGRRADRDDEANARALAIATESASRLLRKEVKAMQQLAVRHAGSQDAFAVAVTEFYAAHAALVSQALQMDDTEAAAYCAGQAAQVLGDQGLHVLTSWMEPQYAAGVAVWALEGEVAA